MLLAKIALEATGSFNFTAIPEQIYSNLMLTDMSQAYMITFIIWILITIIPTAYFTLDSVILGSVVVMDCLLFVAMGWLDGWVSVMLTMFIAGLWAFGFMSGVLRGD